jgi:threonine dehydrogenase-like Zn-dependent dehydrogenase
LGLSVHGGLAEYVVAPKDICVPIPDDVTDESAALTQPLAVGIHGVRRAGVKKAIKSFCLVLVQLVLLYVWRYKVMESM